MDNIFDSLIYIIIAIVGFVISMLGKKKKRDAKRVPMEQIGQTQPKPKERPLLSNLEKLLNEELGIADNKYEETYEEEVEEEKEPVLDSPISKLDTTNNILDTVPEEMLDDEEDLPYSIEYDENSEIFKHSITDQLEDEQEEEGVEITDFDLRDAVIYSEIINRKEY